MVFVPDVNRRKFREWCLGVAAGRILATEDALLLGTARGPLYHVPRRSRDDQKE